MEICFNCKSADITKINDSIWCNNCDEYVARKKFFTSLTTHTEADVDHRFPVSIEIELDNHLDPDEEEEMIQNIDSLLEANAEELLPEHSGANILGIETTEDMTSFDDIIAQFAQHQYGNYVEEDKLGIGEYPNLERKDYLGIGRDIFNQQLIDYIQQEVDKKIKELIEEGE